MSPSLHGAGREISGSPFPCHVVAGDVDASSSRLFGAGLQAVQLGRESPLFCELADAFGNKVGSAAANGADLKVLTRANDVVLGSSQLLQLCRSSALA